MRHHPNGSLKNIMAFSAFSNKVSSTKKMFPDLFLEDVYLLFEYFTWSLKPKSKSKKSSRTYTVSIPKPSGLYINILLLFFIPGLWSHLGKVQLLKWKMSQKSTGKDLNKNDILYSSSNITQLQLQLYFYKNIDYIRLARKIAIANLSRPVEEK